MRSAIVLVALVIGAGAAAADKHLGVASCASGVCHGKVAASETANVWLNEYRIWSTRDRHSRAYQTLLSDESKAIAGKLGLPSAHTAEVCLDCHADNVPAELRGPKFQLSDGVGCEACHGGSERWIESHAEPDATHADNLARGLTATEQASARAAVCFGCHMGDRSRLATHRIMGAGHPRLSFELEAFSVNQPAHYEVDDDYRQRKGAVGSVRLWFVGQIEGADRMLELIMSERWHKSGAFPELAFYDCHACHHPMSELRWNTKLRDAGIEPGQPRLNDHHLAVLGVALGVLVPEDAARLEAARRALIEASDAVRGERLEAAGELRAMIADGREAWREAATAEQAAALRRAIAAAAAAGRLADFGDAEQAFLALETLSFAIGDQNRLADRLDALFVAVETDEAYAPARFAAAARALVGAL